MKLFQTLTFRKYYKKLIPEKRKLVDQEIHKILGDPSLGDLKKGDLAGIRVYKFSLDHQLILLAYVYDKANSSLTLLALGTHENFYKNLKIK